MQIRSKIHDYSVFFEDTLETALRNSADGTKPYFLVDKKVYHLYKDSFDFIGSEQKIYLFEALEENKSYAKTEPVFNWLLESNFRKDCCLIVVGGGITQDVGCFIATVLFRGAKWKLIPTTLLAQGDSCIGSKSSINIGSYKNQLGSFYPPFSVHLTFDVLSTLQAEDILSGAGEMIKLALLDSEAAFQKTKMRLKNLPGDRTQLPLMVQDALTIKKRYIEEDEFDRGVRNILNYGHTFGHGFEAATRYRIPHGIAVTLGMMAATHVSCQLGMVTEEHLKEVSSVLVSLCRDFIPILKDTDPELILNAMKHDKKNSGNKVTCILTRGFGRMEKVQLDLEAELRGRLKGFLATL